MSQSLIYPGTSVAGELNLSHYVAFGFQLSALINLIHWFLEISFCPLIQCRLIWFQFVPVGNKIHNQCSGRSIVNSLRSDLVFSLQNNLAVTPFKQGHFFINFIFERLNAVRSPQSSVRKQWFCICRRPLSYSRIRLWNVQMDARRFYW